MKKQILIDLYEDMKEQEDIAHGHSQCGNEVSRNYYEGKRDAFAQARRMIAVELNADLQERGLKSQF
jgi:hypothetical protein